MSLSREGDSSSKTTVTLPVPVRSALGFVVSGQHPHGKRNRDTLEGQALVSNSPRVDVKRVRVDGEAPSRPISLLARAIGALNGPRSADQSPRAMPLAVSKARTVVANSQPASIAGTSSSRGDIATPNACQASHTFVSNVKSGEGNGNGTGSGKGNRGGGRGDIISDANISRLNSNIGGGVDNDSVGSSNWRAKSKNMNKNYRQSASNGNRSGSGNVSNQSQDQGQGQGHGHGQGQKREVESVNVNNGRSNQRRGARVGR